MHGVGGFRCLADFTELGDLTLPQFVVDDPKLARRIVFEVRDGKLYADFITWSNNVESVYRRVIEPNPDPLHPYGPVQDFSVINETNYDLRRSTNLFKTILLGANIMI